MKVGKTNSTYSRAGRSGDQDNPLVPLHSRMRGFDRDLIRGKHYGQRSCEPHLKGRTHGCTDQVCYAKILLANQEPSTHGTKRSQRSCSRMFGFEGKAKIGPSPRLFVSSCPGPISTTSLAARIACATLAIMHTTRGAIGEARENI